MEREGDDVPSDPSGAQTPTLDLHDKAAVEALLVEIQALRVDTQEILRLLDDVCKNIHLSEAETRSLRATCREMVEQVKFWNMRKELKRVIKALEERTARVVRKRDAVSRGTARDLKAFWVLATLTSAFALAVYLREVRQT